MNMTVNSLPFLVFFTLTAVIYYLFPILQWAFHTAFTLFQCQRRIFL